jgi:hypothetical protein
VIFFRLSHVEHMFRYENKNTVDITMANSSVYAERIFLLNHLLPIKLRIGLCTRDQPSNDNVGN